MRLDDETRLREEDPGTGPWTAIAPSGIVVHRSRFEVDMNRPREGAVYMTPDQSWGLDVWRERLPSRVVAESLALYDRFYWDLGALLTRLVSSCGRVLVYDLHTYNHVRGGPGSEPAPQDENPDVNIGTRWIDRARWSPVVEAFVHSASSAQVRGRSLDVRENVRFQGGHMSAWISDRFPDACVLAVEVKKIFMDEWTGRPDAAAWHQVRDALQSTVAPTLEALGARTRGRTRNRAREKSRA